MSWQNGRSVFEFISQNDRCQCSSEYMQVQSLGCAYRFSMVVFFFCFGFETYLFNFGSLFDFNIGFFYLECTKKILILSHSIHTHHMRLLYFISFPFSSILRHIHGLHILREKKSIPFLMRLCIYHTEEETKKRTKMKFKLDISPSYWLQYEDPSML